MSSVGERSSSFTAGRLLAGVVLFTAIGAGALFALARFTHGPGPGVIVFRDGGTVKTIAPRGGTAPAGRARSAAAAAQTFRLRGSFSAVRQDAGMLIVDSHLRAVTAVDSAIPLTASPDGRELLYAALAPSDRPRLILLETKDWSRRETGILGEFGRAELGPRGTIAVLGHHGDDPGGSVYTLLGNAIRRIGRVRDVDAFAWLSDGSGLAITYRDGAGVERLGMLSLDGRLRALAAPADPGFVAVVAR